MSRFKVVLDKRIQRKSGKYDLSIRYNKGKEVMYLKLNALNEKQYDHVFVKKSMDADSIDFRKKCNDYITKCERIYNEMVVFDKKEFRNLFFDRKLVDTSIEKTESKKLRRMFEEYVESKKMKVKTKEIIMTSINVLERFKHDLTIDDITPEFLEDFTQERIKKFNTSRATIGSYMRNLRAVINYQMKVKKSLPKDYEYPFGKGSYIISSYFPSKIVLSDEEIKKIIEFKDFSTEDQKYARDVWLTLYRMNGINFVDLFRLKWSDLGKGKIIAITRQKTETTRKSNIKPISIPFNPKVAYSLDSIGKKNSKYVLGFDLDKYEDKALVNLVGKVKQKINQNLEFLTKKLELSVPLKLGTARDCYATTLLRANKSIQQISEMLGHSNVIVTNHYLGSRSADQTYGINDVIM